MPPSLNTSSSHDRLPTQLAHSHHHHYYSSSSPAIAASLAAPRASSTGAIARTNPRTPTAPPLLHDPSHPTEPLTLAVPDLIPKSYTPDLRRKPHSAQSHSRSSSTNNIRDAASNLNRWSQSTSSSKGSEEHKRSRSFSRRLSLASNPFTTHIASSSGSPNRLQKGRTVNGNSPVRPPPAPRLFESPHIPPPQLLPPIVTLPTLQQAVDAGATPLATVTSISSPNLLSGVSHSTTGLFGRQWEESNKIPQLTISSSNASALHASRTNPTVADQPDTILESRMIEEAGDQTSRGHSRHRSQAEKGSASSTRSRERSHRRTSQKAMLSKALQKANTAVLLDNAQNFEGAMQAYGEACELLEQVMLRSSGNEDKRKLEAIRDTYKSRIFELQKIVPAAAQYSQKALPARPMSRDEDDEEELLSPILDYEDGAAIIETATITRIVNDPSVDNLPAHLDFSQSPSNHEPVSPTSHPERHQALGVEHPSRSMSRSPFHDSGERKLNLAPMDRDYMPPPLSPRRPITPSQNDGFRPDITLEPPPFLKPLQQNNHSSKSHTRAPSNESMSWLDTIDESSASEVSSVHSRTSSLRLRRKHIRAASGATEAEFDAALDAAVEAAYDDGFEPEPLERMYDDDEIVANVRRRVELARERVRQTERESEIQLARERERLRLLQLEKEPQNFIDHDLGTESDEEERMLEEMTRSYILDDFEFGLQSKFSVPRESDSSGFSGRTWNSSVASNPTTAGTTLSTVAEDVPALPPMQPRLSPPRGPPPSTSLPAHPPAIPASSIALSSSAPSTNVAATQSVRSRRLSGQNPKQLKIETSVSIPAASTIQSVSLAPAKVPGTQHSAKAATITAQIPPSSLKTNPIRQASSPFPGPSSEILAPPTPTLAQADIDGDALELARSGSPGRAQSRSALRKNQSSSSLKNFRSRNLSVSVDDTSDISPNTPLSNPYSAASKEYIGRLPSIPTLPTPLATAFRDKMSVSANPGMSLFDSDIHSPESPGSPNPLAVTAPLPLESCPNEPLLRPFWLMRSLYQTIAHPRGGYLSTRLFVPRDVWLVRNVKLKNVEDKISNCDLLTAALLKLAKVDTCDADAVLDEMQAIESVLEQVQATLAKKLGNEVGVSGSGGLFKDASAGAEDTPAINSRSASTSAKGAFSWRRLRPKTSGVALTGSYASNKTSSLDGAKDAAVYKTVPMTSQPLIKLPKRDVSQAQFTGPNATYMNSLARLFDAAQVIDQIARQVEDPGLRHADKTQVGLELCVRHAAEFFGFYVCRFVLTDISILLDKFIKRGSEWVVV